MPANHHFSEPTELHQDEQFERAQEFAVQRRYNALVPVTGHISGSNVVTVTDESPWESVAEMGAAVIFGHLPGALGVAVSSAYARLALRPTSQGAGRDRWR